MVSSLSQAIRATLAYAQFFNSPLTLKELHFWLISSQQSSLNQIQTVLKKTDQRSAITDQLLPSRQRRLHYARSKFRLAYKVTRLLRLIPSIQLVAATGSLAVANTKKNDDIDLMIITSPHTLWLTRPLVVLLLKLARLRRPPNLKAHTSRQVANKICDNLWLDTTALALPQAKRNLYTAHEVLQIKPLLNRAYAYESFILSNSWTKKYIANAYISILKKTQGRPTSRAQSSERREHDFWLTRVLNRYAFHFQYLYMKKKLTCEHVTFHSAYFHPRDLSQQIQAHLDQKL